ncbi:nucleotide disphospho-sugar-binding domain-containing protein [Paracoccus sp. S1E-3]|uniref:glycosyltransferase n=2 Tax=Rhodobacterales TaxID=204455 RepID=UPI0015EEF8D2|nr:nucleotide disphospho-sugar-binding domain-containing protein [Paracoccus sp. S1E-3]MBA4491597.1 glycosyltransferase [Paracoccus sp. S1E-3]
MVGSTGFAPLAARERLPHLALGGSEPDLHGAGLVRTLLATAQATALWVRCGPDLLGRAAPDLVIADQAEPGASLAAEAAGLPSATLASALPMDRDDAIPPPFVDWPYQDGESGMRRNRGGWRVADALMMLQSRALAKGCRDHGLPRRDRISDWISSDLDLRQMVPELDFPHELAAGAAPVGPLRDGGDETLDIEPDGRPIVFASLGTLQGGRRHLLGAIASAVEGTGVRLLLAHAGGLTDAQVRALPGRPEARVLWPQQAVLARAAACVTHAGMNTALDCVAARVPMLAVPLAFEQPATAARLAHHGVARVVAPRRATADHLRAALQEVLADVAMRAALSDRATALSAAGGVGRAADLVERMLSANVPTAQSMGAVA